jgi:NADPH:quinone reductase-like Zn-dependent oxidoreductase
MESIQTARAQLGDAAGVTAALWAGWNAFAVIDQVAVTQTEGHSGSYATWMSVIAPACEGRDALAQAPSMPDSPAPRAEAIETAKATADDEAVAGLAAVLLQRLRLACGQATDAEDRRAFLLGIAAAEEICRLLAADG